jgi:hypothetical protein
MDPRYKQSNPVLIPALFKVLMLVDDLVLIVHDALLTTGIPTDGVLSICFEIANVSPPSSNIMESSKSLCPRDRDLIIVIFKAARVDGVLNFPLFLGFEEEPATIHKYHEYTIPSKWGKGHMCRYRSVPSF